MKKSLLALAALTAFAGAASAQSSVTLFGILDVNAKRVTNETAAGSRSLASLSQDGIASSRLGFRGVEDIGGGVRAGFWLEAGLNPDTGGQGGAAGSAGTTTYNRRSTVSLMGGFGEIRLGRDYTPDFWNHTVYDPFGTNGVGNSTNTFNTLFGIPATPPATNPIGSAADYANVAGTLVRTNNSIGYFLPALGGVFGQVQVSAGEGGIGNKHTGGRIGYAGGPVSIAVAFGRTDIAGPPNVEYSRVNIGGSYNLGFMTLMAQFNRAEQDGGLRDKREVDHYLVGAVVPFGASSLKFSYVNSDGSGGAFNTFDASQIAVGYQYDLSKRTAIYANFARISNDGSANYTIGGGVAGQIAGKDSTGIEFGVRHTF
jgi:predicted porin